jgi:hypothetical protein
MVRKFWGNTRWRYDRWIWGSALFLIALVQACAGQQPFGVLVLLFLAGVCLFSAWRRSTTPLYTVTDDELLIGTALFGTKRLRWRAVKTVQQDAYGVRLIGWQWFGGLPLSLTGLPRADRDEFMQLVRARVEAANAAYEADS